MAYEPNLPAAARRHQAAAKSLDLPMPEGRPDVAGYLYGIACECALKALMARAGLKSTGKRSEDPFFLHFPAIKTALRDSLTGRSKSALLRYALDQSLMQGWDVAMRYAHGKDIKEASVRLWERQATGMLNAMEEF